MSVHQIKRGLDIPIAGAASGTAVELDLPATVAYTPVEFKGIVPKLAKREGDTVKAGEALFFHKHSPEMVFLSPVSGTVKEVRRGRRRVITDIVVERGGDDVVEFKKWTLDGLGALDADAARKLLLEGGMWGNLRTRPLDRIPAVDSAPQAIFISATETGPLMPGAAELLGEGDADALQAAVTVLSKLAPSIHLTVPAGAAHPAWAGLTKGAAGLGLQVHEFAGPHPAGDAGVQVNLVDPPRGKNEVWYLSAWDAVLIGRLALEGRFPAERVYAAVGTGVRTPRFVRTVLGAPLAHIVGDVVDEEVRWIRGSVLTGEKVDSGRWASWYGRAVHVLPEAVEREVVGWALPQFGKWSAHRAYPKGLLGSGGTFDLRPGLYGGHRAIVPIGQYAKVIATPDIVPEFLFRSIIAGDLEESIQLGLLDLTMEEAALCSYVCPSKIDFDILLREGLDTYEREA
ncbi:MAG: NADH:ubiquinone reductase (Na(+)-transporting) subunit A [Proteobacteria bacterium]|nr:NADH:ubiquinone reductase (Na(+)-transporting) subunit A [Pseudomonadota bacterium]